MKKAMYLISFVVLGVLLGTTAAMAATNWYTVDPSYAQVSTYARLYKVTDASTTCYVLANYGSGIGVSCVK